MDSFFDNFRANPELLVGLRLRLSSHDKSFKLSEQPKTSFVPTLTGEAREGKPADRQGIPLRALLRCA
jgi:hypothetical protein